MLALHFDGTRLSLAERPLPRPPEGECLIRVEYSGICNTDLEILRGYMAFSGIPGHEFVGTVEKCSASEWEGRRVVGEINCGCGQCEYCRRGLARHCPNRTVLGILGRDGAHAEFTVLPLENLHPVPDSVSSREAVFVEPLAAALEIAEQLHLPPGQNICVLGDGKLGQLIARVLRLYSPKLTVVGKHAEKLRLLEKFGVNTLPASEANDLPGQDVVVEATGRPEGLALATRLIKPRGTLVLKSTYHGELSFNPAPWVIDEVTVLGSRCGPFAPALRLLEQGLVEVKDLISAEFPREDALQAFQVAREPESLKVLVHWS